MANPCNAVLVPNIVLANSSDVLKYAWLNLITSDNYQSAQTTAGASGDVELTDLFKVGNADANYAQFDENRQQYFKNYSGNIDSAASSSILQQSVPDSARTDFVNCMSGPGKELQAWFENDSHLVATAVIVFNGNPGSSVRYTIELVGGTAVNPSDVNGPKTLLTGGRAGIPIIRNSPSSDIYLNVNGPSLQADAYSVSPVKLVPVLLTAYTTSNLNGVMLFDGTFVEVAWGKGALGDAYDNAEQLLPFVGPRFAEWTFAIAGPIDYSVTVKYAAKDSRPLDISVNGVTVIQNAFAAVTGGWEQSFRRTFPAGNVSLIAGNNTIRISCPNNQAFPTWSSCLSFQ